MKVELRTCFDCEKHNKLRQIFERKTQIVPDWVYCKKQHKCVRFIDAIVCSEFEGKNNVEDNKTV